MKKLRVEEVIVVEGKYDAVKLADLVDGFILTTNGFSVFKNAETKRLLVELGKKRGIIVLTDSDDAGFRIRNYINKLAQGICVKNAYVPAIAGKERRKAQCCFSKRMRKVFRKNEKSMLQKCNKKSKRKGRLQRVKKPM